MARRALEHWTETTVSVFIPLYWLDLADYTGFSFDRWLREIVHEYLTTGPGRLIPSPPIHFRRGTFEVEGAPVRGYVGGPFGAYKQRGRFVFVHLPSGRPLARLRRLWDCGCAADELADLKMRWDLPEGGQGRLLCEPDIDKVAPILARYGTPLLKL
jgi:hypothetical protein